MIPVVTPEEMAAIDAAAPDAVEELIGRAGAATAAAALDLMGGTYGRRVLILAGRGHNGDDGRDAAVRLGRRGARCRVVGLDEAPVVVEDVDLFVDAALGTGARPGFAGPRVADGIPVLAVDLPSGVDGLTGEAADGVVRADRTVTFAALKPGLLLGRGRELAGDVRVADIGLDVSRARAGLVTDDDLAQIPLRRPDAHKWRSAVWIVAGSEGMLGAARLCATAAQRAGAGYVRLSSPGVDHDPLAPTEPVGVALPSSGWARQVLADVERVAAVAVGPGLGRSAQAATEVRALLADCPVPIVVDGDGLAALGDRPAQVLADRPAPTVLTPHDGELRRLLGGAPGPDRTATARDLAARSGATTLLKGATTVVADPGGEVRYVTSGDARLATAGTGDVLTGVIAALLAQGLGPLDAAALGAHLHGRAGAVGSARGLVAGDIPGLLPLVLDKI